MSSHPVVQTIHSVGAGVGMIIEAGKGDGIKNSSSEIQKRDCTLRKKRLSISVIGLLIMLANQEMRTLMHFAHP